MVTGFVMGRVIDRLFEFHKDENDMVLWVKLLTTVATAEPTWLAVLLKLTELPEWLKRFCGKTMEIISVLVMLKLKVGCSVKVVEVL